MKDYIKYFDKFTFMVLILISLLGVFLINSASHTIAEPYYLKQLIWLIISLTVFLIAFKIKTEILFRFSALLFGFILVLLAILLLAGRITAGTKSWFHLGFFNIQVSEFVKIPLALYLAKLLTKIEKIDWQVFLKFIVILGIPFTLIAVQPDLGTSFILVSFFIMAVFLKGIRLSIIIFLLVIICAGSVLTWYYVLKPYQKDRITSFLNPEKYKKSSGYQIIQSKIAIGSGGLKGKGYLKGSQSRYRFLPTRHTDFIVSVLGEEFGFLGISFLFLLFFILFYRQFNFKSQSDEEFYFVFLFNGLILFQFLINVLMSIGLIPILGVPLPFVSYGGSSLLAFYIGEALIFKIKINNYISEF